MQAAKLEAVLTNGDDFELLGANGRPVEKKLMAEKIDDAAGKQVTISRGTLAAFAIAPAILMLFLQYGLSVTGIIRSDQTKDLEIKQLQADMNSMKLVIATLPTMTAQVTNQQQDLKDIKDSMRQLQEGMKSLEIKSAFRLGVTSRGESNQ